MTVKDESVVTFLKDVTINLPEHIVNIQDCNRYNLLKDEILIKRGSIPFNEIVLIEIKDVSSGSGKELINSYYYEVQDYDDVCSKMILTNFEVEAVS